MPDLYNKEIATMIAVGSSIYLFLAGVLIAILMASQKKKFQHAQRITAMESTFQNQLMQSQIEIQESIFEAMGQELHDNIGQLLSSTKLLLGITEKSLDPIPDTLRTAEETLGKAIQDLRSLTRSINKEWLSQFNLIENLHAETTRINAGNILQVQLLYSQSVLPLPAEKQVLLFRIIQEALQNCIKHAKASEITVHLSCDEVSLQVSIDDDGNGFSTDSNFKNGLGIRNMQHRTKLLDGTIDWSSVTGKGTHVQINLPVKNENL